MLIKVTTDKNQLFVIFNKDGKVILGIKLLKLFCLMFWHFDQKTTYTIDLININETQEKKQVKNIDQSYKTKLTGY